MMEDFTAGTGDSVQQDGHISVGKVQCDGKRVVSLVERVIPHQTG